jgi:CheY-like chemotaxis protein
MVLSSSSWLRMTDCLREAGYSVVETASGEEAIAFCKSNMSIDIVFIDIVFTDISLVGSASGWDGGNAIERVGRMSR